MVSISAAAAGDVTSREYQIKAAFLFSFAKFIEWPAQSFQSANSPIVIGTFCDSPFAGVLEGIVKGRAINGRSLQVRPLETAGSAREVHLAFVCESEDRSSAAILDAVRTWPVVTVGESNDFWTQDGMIHFVPVDDKVRFEINIGAAERAGVKISAQLQKLALMVKKAP